MDMKRDESGVVEINDTPHLLVVPFKKPIILLGIFIISLLAYFKTGSNQLPFFIVIPIIFLCTTGILYGFSYVYNFLIKAYPITVLIDEKQNLITIIQRGMLSQHKTTLPIDEIKKIEHYGFRFYNPVLIGIELGGNWTEGDIFGGSSCGIYFYMNSGERKSVNSYIASYTGVYKEIAEKIGRVINIPVVK
jgi:hypothetical protein